MELTGISHTVASVFQTQTQQARIKPSSGDSAVFSEEALRLSREGNGNNAAENAVGQAKLQAARDDRTEADTLEFWQIPSVMAEYAPTALILNQDAIGIPAATLPTLEEITAARQEFTEVRKTFEKAFNQMGVDYDALSQKEQYYLMRNESFTANLQQSFLTIREGQGGS